MIAEYLLSYAFVYPYSLYGTDIYANAYASYLDKLVKINNKMLRILSNQPTRTSVSHLCETFDLLPIVSAIHSSAVRQVAGYWSFSFWF